MVNLANSKEDYIKYLEDYNLKDKYINELYKNDSIVFLSCTTDYANDEYKGKIVNGFKAIIENKGPFYIHCLEGTDRTGFVCLLLECLADFSLEELEKDYMATTLTILVYLKEIMKDIKLLKNYILMHLLST